MARLATSIIAGILLLCSGCSNPPKEVKEVPDPLKDFKGVVAAFSTNASACYTELPTGFSVDWDNDVQIDVEKTTSLVSPYTATANYSRKYNETRGERSIGFKADFAYQDNKWVLQEVDTVPANFWIWSGYRFCRETETKCWQGALDKLYKTKSG